MPNLCSKCCNEIPKNAKECPNCGQIVQAERHYCQICGEELDNEHQEFCDICNKSSSMSKSGCACGCLFFGIMILVFIYFFMSNVFFKKKQVSVPAQTPVEQSVEEQNSIDQATENIPSSDNNSSEK